MKASLLKRDYLIILGVALAVRIAYGAAVDGWGRFSGQGYTEYMLVGERMLQHGTLVSPLVGDEAPVAPSAMMPPAYAVLIAALYGLFGVRSFSATLIAQLINAVAMSLAAVFAGNTADRLAGRRAGWIAAGLVALQPALVAYTEYIWDTSLFVFGTALTVWWSLRLGAGGAGRKRWFIFGLFLGGLALLNPALTVAYPLLVLWPVSRGHEWNGRAIARAAGFAACGWLVFIGPWTVRNYLQFGELFYVRSGLPHELWLGSCPEADTSRSDVFVQQFALSNAEVRGEVTRIGEFAYLTQCGRRAAAAIASNPWRFARLVGLRTVDFWAGTVFTHTPRGGDPWPHSKPRAATLLFFSLETGLLLILFLIRGRKDRDGRWLLGVIVVFSLIYCITHVQIRFRIPIEPIVAVLLSVLLVQSRHKGDRAAHDRKSDVP